MLQNFALWLALRLITSLWAALVSQFRPLNPIELAFPLWPPQFSTNWLERVLLAPWLRWDAHWYLRIVTSGYQSGDGTLQFHPLYPWLAAMLHRIGIHPVLALLIISTAASLALLVAYEQLARLDLSLEESRLSTLLFTFFPISFILFAPYSESLFILCSVLCFWAVRKRTWLLAGLAGLLASFTRQQGLFLIIPVVWEIWEYSSHNLKQIMSNWRYWWATVLTVGGYLLWVVYRRFYFFETPSIHSGANDWIFSLLISPNASQVVPQQAFLMPWQALGLAIRQFAVKPDLDMSFNFLISGAFLILFAISFNKMRMSYRLYSLVIILVSFSYYTGTVHPYMGLPRHLYLAFPVFIGFASFLRQPAARLAYTGIGVVSMLILLTGYSLEAWVP